MSEQVGEAVITVRTDESGVDYNAAGKRAGTGYTKGFSSGLKGLAGAIGIAVAARGAFNFTKDSIAEAREAQKVGRTTAAILKATSGAAKVNRVEYDRLTASLMRKTAIDDEQIATGGNLLLTFKNVKREGKGLSDIFGRGLAAALDVSAAGFGSIEGASKMLGKALNDPVKGVTALGRAGVTFSEDQKAAIAAMVESNNLLGAQKLILKEVESQVGGTAEKQVTSAQRLSVAWGNVKEEIGGALLPVIDDLADFMLDKGIPAARDFGDWLEDDGVPALRHFTEEVTPLVKRALPLLGDALGQAKDQAERLLPIAEGVIDAFQGMPDWAQKLIIGGVGGGTLALKLTGLGGSGGILSKGATPITPLYVWVVNGGAGSPGGGDVPKTLGAGLAALAKNPLVKLGGVLTALYAVLPGGDNPSSGPQEPRKPRDAAYIKLLEETGARTQDELLDTLGNASVEKMRELRKMLKDEFGVGFRELSSIDFGDGKGDLGALGAFSVTALRRSEENLRSLLSVGGEYEDLLAKLPPKVETKLLTPGLINSTTGVNQLIRQFDLHLDKREVRTAYRMAGVTESIKDLRVLGGYLNGLEERYGDFKTRFAARNGQNLGALGQNARGTDYWRGGRTWVGEQGPEIVDLPRGSQVIPAAESAAIAGGTVINIGQIMPHNYSEFTRQMTERARAAGLGGRRPVMTG